MLQYYLCSVLHDEVGMVNKRVRMIISSGRYSTIYVVYFMIKLAF